jgi:hypothetical protein
MVMTAAISMKMTNLKATTRSSEAVPPISDIHTLADVDIHTRILT